jgi:hypothetical protein
VRAERTERFGTGARTEGGGTTVVVAASVKIGRSFVRVYDICKGNQTGQRQLSVHEISERGRLERHIVDATKENWRK